MYTQTKRKKCDVDCTNTHTDIQKFINESSTEFLYEEFSTMKIITYKECVGNKYLKKMNECLFHLHGMFFFLSLSLYSISMYPNHKKKFFLLFGVERISLCTYRIHSNYNLYYVPKKINSQMEVNILFMCVCNYHINHKCLSFFSFFFIHWNQKTTTKWIKMTIFLYSKHWLFWIIIL